MQAENHEKSVMKEVILSILELSEEDYSRFELLGKFIQSSKYSTILEVGNKADQLFFLTSGTVRAFRNIEGTEFTHFFFNEKWFVTDFKCYLTNTRSKLNIESLTDVCYFTFKKSDLIKLFDSCPKFERLRSIISERAYLFTVERLESLQTKKLQERYNELMDQNPDLFLTHSQKDIASYLGVAQQSLSRIKSH